MSPRALRAAAAASCTVLAAGALLWWMSARPRIILSEGLPGEDGAPITRTGRGADAGAATPHSIETHFQKFAELSRVLPGEWPSFRGPERDNIAKDTPPLSDLSGAPPRVVWNVDVGEGHAGAAVSGGRVYLLDYIEAEKADALRCFSLADGVELWRRWYPAPLKRNHGFSRTVPAVSGRYVVTLGPSGHAMCVDAETGDLQWVFSLTDAYGGKIPPWNTGQCPLIDGGQVIFAPAGRALMIGVDIATGKALWETPNPDGWQMSHSSIMRYDLDGKPVYLYSAIGGVAAVSAADEDLGTLAWKSTEWNVQVVAPSPIVLPGSQVYLTAGYGAGSMVLEIEGARARLVNARTPDRGMSSEQQTPILYRGRVFEILPQDGGELHNQLACMTPNGSVVWSSGKTDRFGLGPYILADGKFYILDDNGTLSAVAASTSEYERLGRAAIMDGKGVDAWGPMALAGSRLILRDATRLFCVELQGE